MASSARNDRTPQAAPPARLHEGQRHGRIVSRAPGRMRVRLGREHRDPEALAQIQRELGAQAGVSSVTTDHRTGSILVRYDHLALAKDDVTSMLLDVGIVALDLIGAEDAADELGEERAPRGVAPHSTGASSVLDAVTDLDHRISRLTGGRLDLKLLVPAGLGLLALRQIGLNGLGLGQVPGYVLLWYTFDSFYKLHQRKTAAAAKEATEQILEEGGSVQVDGAAGARTIRKSRT
jgi:hypothetical protein